MQETKETLPKKIKKNKKSENKIKNILFFGISH
jgi:hypothetical protein